MAKKGKPQWPRFLMAYDDGDYFLINQIVEH
jgi:hypothetical protein